MDWQESWFVWLCMSFVYDKLYKTLRSSNADDVWSYSCIEGWDGIYVHSEQVSI